MEKGPLPINDACMLDSSPCMILEYAGVVLSRRFKIGTPHSEGCWHLQDASAAFAESVADLAPAELLHMGMDTSGSRSLEAFLGRRGVCQGEEAGREEAGGELCQAGQLARRQSCGSGLLPHSCEPLCFHGMRALIPSSNVQWPSVGAMC